jgi:Txe/YoeB family toxin of Txe-Axe toxin-antitoxin module
MIEIGSVSSWLHQGKKMKKRFEEQILEARNSEYEGIASYLVMFGSVSSV